MKRLAARGHCCVMAALLMSSTGMAQSDEPFLAKLSIERASGAVTPLGESVVFSLHVSDSKKAADALAAVNGVEVLSVDEDSVRILSTDSPTTTGAATEKLLAASFVIDFDEDAVSSLLADIHDRYGALPTARQIESYVFEHIGEKTYARSFDLASKVAATGEGDCTEHAVLLAALVRASGLYARVIFGTLVIELDSTLLAYGHAWTEVYDGEHWQILDATLPGNDPTQRQVRYLPAAVFEDEGPGYTFGMFAAMSLMPIKITGVSNPD